MSDFNAVDVKNKCVDWIREFFEKNGKDCNAVVGISGGKDKSVISVDGRIYKTVDNSELLEQLSRLITIKLR